MVRPCSGPASMRSWQGALKTRSIPMTDEAVSPVAPAHDRRHDDPQVIAEDPARLHPHDQELGSFPWPVARHGDFATIKSSAHSGTTAFALRSEKRAGTWNLPVCRSHLHSQPIPTPGGIGLC